jgi:hypothetical protein
VERASAAGKPVLCAVSPASDEVHADAALGRLERDLVHMALWPALTILREALADRCQESLGRPLLIQASWVRRAEEAGQRSALLSPAALALVRACGDLFGSTPLTVLAQTAGQAFTSLVLEFDQARVAQLTLWDGPAALGACGLSIQAEGGSAWAELPHRLSWLDGEGRHTQELPAGLAEVVTVDRFLQAMRNREAPACGFAEAHEALDWLRAAQRSLNEGRRVAMGQGR